MGQLTASPPIERSFRAEKAAEVALPAALVLLEGGVVGVIAAKIYQVSPFVLALVSAAPMFASNFPVFFGAGYLPAAPKSPQPAFSGLDSWLYHCRRARAQR